MFFTFSKRFCNVFESCYLKHDIRPHKKGDFINCIVKKPDTTTFLLFVEYGRCYEMCLAKFIKFHSSVKKIQRAWRRCISDPEYKICKKRLLDELNEVVFPKCSREIEKFEYDFRPDYPEIYDKPLHSTKYHLKYNRRHMYMYDYSESEEDELPMPSGKRIFF